MTIGTSTVALILANPALKSSQLLTMLHEVTPGGTDKTVAWYRVHVGKCLRGEPCKLTPTERALVGGTPPTSLPAPRTIARTLLPREETYTLDEARAILAQRAQTSITAQLAKLQAEE